MQICAPTLSHIVLHYIVAVYKHAWNNDLSSATWTIAKYAYVRYSICYFSIVHIFRVFIIRWYN